MSYQRQKGWWEGHKNKIKYGHEAGLVGKAIEDASNKQQTEISPRRNYALTEEQGKLLGTSTERGNITRNTKPLELLRTGDPEKQKEVLRQKVRERFSNIDEKMELVQAQYDMLNDRSKKAGLAGLTIGGLLGPILAYLYITGWLTIYQPFVFSLGVGTLLLLYMIFCIRGNTENKETLKQHRPKLKRMQQAIKDINKLEGESLSVKVAEEIRSRELSNRISKAKIQKLKGSPESDNAAEKTEERVSPIDKEKQIAELEAQVAEKEKDQKIKELEAKLAAMEAAEKNG